MFEEDEIKYFEEWRDIEGYDGLYQVSNLGRVKSLKWNKERILKLRLDSNGYLTVGLCKDGKLTTKIVHRLVAEAFIDNPENLPEVDHLSTVRTDNRVSNLSWCTRTENRRNPKSIEHYSECKKGEKAPMYGKFGKEHNCSKPILQYSLDGELVGEWDCGMDVQRELGIKQQNISNCCRGKLKTAYGFIWRYKN